MEVYSVSDIRKLVDSRKETKDLVVKTLEVETDQVHFRITLLFRFWAQYRTYLAIPVAVDGDMLCSVALIMPNEWRRYLRHEVRRMFGVRHLHNVNPPENQARIESFLGVTNIHK